MENGIPILDMRDVSLVIDTKTILKDISFSVRQGENWAVIGKNGAGKSFLLRMIAAQHFPTAGTIDLLGKRFGEYDLWKLKTHIGFVSDLLQKNYHGGDPGEEVVLSGYFSSIGLYDRVTAGMRRKAKALLAFLGIEDLAERPFDRMSHGEQRKTLLARAMVLDPALLILDEPCTGLDLATREEFLDALSRLARTKTAVILVTHHLEEIIPEIDRLLCLKDGMIAFQGPTRKLMTPGNLTRLFDHPVTLEIKNKRYYAAG
ncbi:MAG TPA: ABC transporter ATP-binding protein [Spirochaetia bacterium]|nr:ABC transporter ATP-binding protein [Spirochaetia bacterium]